MIIPPKDGNEVGGLALPMRTRYDIEAAAGSFATRSGTIGTNAVRGAPHEALTAHWRRQGQ